MTDRVGQLLDTPPGKVGVVTLRVLFILEDVDAVDPGTGGALDGGRRHRSHREASHALKSKRDFT